MKNVLIVGATSAIAQSVARIYAEQKFNIALWGRNAQRLNVIKQDLEVRGAKAFCFFSDLNQYEQNAGVVRKAFETLGSFDIVLVAQGYLGDQQKAEDSLDETLQIINSNYVSCVAAIHHVVPLMKSGGVIAVLSSVAGDRGKQSNYTYGSAKAALSVYVDGLRNRLSKKGIHAVDFKLGFVDSPMTKDFKKGALWATPDQVANGIVKAIDAKKDIVYLPFFWRFIMMIICSVPEKIFKKLSL